MGLFSKQKNVDLTLRIPDMHCENCERRVRTILEGVPGVASVKPDAGKHTVAIGLKSESPATEEAIRKELEAGGYPAE